MSYQFRGPNLRFYFDDDEFDHREEGYVVVNVHSDGYVDEAMTYSVDRKDEAIRLARQWQESFGGDHRVYKYKTRLKRKKVWG